MGICVNDIQFFYNNKKISHEELERIKWQLTLKAMSEKLFGPPILLVRCDDEKKEWYFECGLW